MDCDGNLPGQALPGGEQSMLLMGQGKDPTTAELQALGKRHRLKHVPEILTRVRSAVAKWPEFAEPAGVSSKSSGEILSRIRL